MTMQSTLFVFGLAMLIAIELLRWLADMPAEVGTALSSIAWLMIAGPAAISARANRTPPDERGFGRPLLLLLVAVLAGVMLVLAPGCASTREVTLAPDDPPATFDMERGPPCVITVYEAPGKKTASVRHDSKRCEFILDGQVIP